MLTAYANEHPTDLNMILLSYQTNIVLGSTTPPLSTDMITSKIGDLGKYFIKGLMNDTVNLLAAYLFVTDNNVNSGTFGVFKMDFTPSPPNYIYTTLSMSSGSAFSVNCILRTSSTDTNDFLFAGKALSLTNGTTTKTFPTGLGYVMKGKTSDSN